MFMGEFKHALDEKKRQEMIACIEQAATEKDSVGGILETAILHCPAGIGEPFFHSAESQLSQYLFSIPAVKGIEFGMGFDFVNHKGSEANDAFSIENGVITTMTNHNGAINGGIANGMPILFRCVIKPTASIFQKQKTVNYDTKENIEFELSGRHDPAIFHRARVVVDAMTACCILDLCAEKYGTDWMR